MKNFVVAILLALGFVATANAQVPDSRIVEPANWPGADLEVNVATGQVFSDGVLVQNNTSGSSFILSAENAPAYDISVTVTGAEVYQDAGTQVSFNIVGLFYGGEVILSGTGPVSLSADVYDGGFDLDWRGSTADSYIGFLGDGTGVLGMDRLHKIRMGSGNDSVYIDNNNYASIDIYKVWGGAGDDYITTGLRGGRYVGGDGNDWITAKSGGIGEKILKGNDGYDVLNYISGQPGDSITTFEEIRN